MLKKTVSHSKSNEKKCNLKTEMLSYDDNSSKSAVIKEKPLSY